MIKAGITKIKLDRRSFERASRESLRHQKVKELAHKRAQEISDRAKQDLIKNFNNHEVTQEIEEGPGADNSSGTIIGAAGNLFTFIGFHDGDNPTSPIKEYLRDKGLVYKTSKFVKASSREGVYEFRVNAPTLKDVEGLAPLPWESGRSWVRGIERGISGIGHYMYQQGVSGSRSGAGIQIKGTLGSSFKRVKYMSVLLNNYVTNLKLGIISK